MDTQTQIDRLIELAIIQRSELKQLVEQLPQLREHLNAEVERTIEEVEPQLRAELEEFCDKRAVDANAKVGSALEAKIVELSKALELTTQARFNAIKEQERKVEELRQLAAKQIEGHVAALPEAVKEIVGAELARFPRAGEIDQLRKEFAEPRGLNPRGKWLPSETYNRLDLVTYNGDSFTSAIDGNRSRPSRNAAEWTLIAARGTGGGGPTSLSELTTVPSNGDLLIGSGTSWVTSNLTAGAGISITVGAGEITISATDGDITLDDGTAASPSLHFTNDPDTGIYRPAANTLGISVSGTQVAYFDENGLTIPSAGVVAGGSFHAANGNANNPSHSFTSDQDTGFYRHATNQIGVSTSGTASIVFTDTAGTMTAHTSTNLTLSGGSSGASLVLGQGASGVATINPQGTGATAFLNIVTQQTGTTDLTSRVLRLASNASNADATIQFTDNTAENAYLGMRQGHINFGAGAQTVQMRLTKTNGNLLIGTTTDGGQKLQVQANESASNTSSALKYLRIQNSNAGGTYTGAIEFYTWDNRRNAAIFAERDPVNGEAGILSFAYSKYGNTFAEGFRISAGGNLLIGGTTDITGSGGLKVYGTTDATAGTLNTGSLITLGGASISKNLNVGTNLTVSGTTGVTATDLILGTSGPSVKSTLSARAPRQGLVFDGTAGSSITSVPAFGTGDYTLIAFGKLNTLPAASVLFGSAVGGIVPQAYVDSSGQIVVSGSSTITSSATISAGKNFCIAVVRSSGTTTIYNNGISVGSAADTRDNSNGIDAIGRNSGGNYVNGVLAPLIYNRALSSSEVVALYEAGAPAAPDFKQSYGTAKTTANGVPYDGTTYASSTFTVPISGIVAFGSIYPAFPGIGVRLRVKFDYTTSTSGNLRIGSYGYVASINGNGDLIPLSGSGTYIYEAVANSTGAGWNANGIEFRGASWAGTLTNIVITPLGLLLAPDAYQAGGGTSWYDTSGNSATITLPASGVTWNVPSSGQTGQISKFNSTTDTTGAGTGALQVAGGAYVAKAIIAGTFVGMVDGVTAPAATSGYAKIYVDTADGDLKIIFGDGTIKTIVTD